MYDLFLRLPRSGGWFSTYDKGFGFQVLDAQARTVNFACMATSNENGFLVFLYVWLKPDRPHIWKNLRESVIDNRREGNTGESAESCKKKRGAHKYIRDF